MTKRLAVAIAVSTGMHLAGFVIADRLLAARAAPDQIPEPLLVTLESRGVLPDSAGERLLYPEPGGRATAERGDDSPAPRQPARDAAADPGPPAAAAAAATEPAAEPAPAPASDPRSDGPVAEWAEEAPAGLPPEPVVAADSPDPDRTAAATVSLSPRQEKMLNRRLRKWTETLHDVEGIPATDSWSFDGHEYVARFTELPADAETGIDRVRVEVSTVDGGKRLSSEVQLKRLAFSSFAQFVNRWDPDVQLHDDELDGRFHANSGINLAYDGTTRPVFHSKVTTASRNVAINRLRGSVRRDQIFQGGLETGVRSIPLPPQFTPIEDADAANVHHVAGDTRITFRADGSYTLGPADAKSEPRSGRLSDDTTYFVADRKSAIHVRGIVNGKVLVYSPERIVIEDDIVYSEDPETVPDSDDFLGLVSDKTVEVAPPGITGLGDLRIHAAIYARGRFAVRMLFFKPSATLHVYGSLSAGTLSATEPRFATRIRFDRRLDEMRPPGFPMTDRYEVESRDADWTVEPVL